MTVMMKSISNNNHFPDQEMLQFPAIINIEVYRGDCPCRCVHCPIGTTDPAHRNERFGNKNFELMLYNKIAEEISEHPESALRIHSAGEPLYWDRLIDALEFTHKKSVTTWIFTCGVTNDIPLLNAICENSSIIEISVNSTSREDYFATKGTDAFDLVVNNITHMNHYITQKSIPTRLIVSRVQSLNTTADNEFIRYWKSTGLVADAFVRTYHTYNNLMPELSLELEGEPLKKEPCLVHWARFNINIDGYAVVCFNEIFKKRLDSSLILGNVNNQTIAEIWHGPELAAIRKAELTRDYSNLCFSESLPCKHCYSNQPLFRRGQTSEYQIQISR